LITELTTSVVPVPIYQYCTHPVSEKANFISNANTSAIFIELYQGDIIDKESALFLRRGVWSHRVLSEGDFWEETIFDEDIFFGIAHEFAIEDHVNSTQPLLSRRASTSRIPVDMVVWRDQVSIVLLLTWRSDEKRDQDGAWKKATYTNLKVRNKVRRAKLMGFSLLASLKRFIELKYIL
jgi:hypothetical protein